jgi:hypothetical protein
MLHHARPFLHLLVVAAAFAATGCHSTTAKEHPLTLVSVAPTTTYQSDMAFTIDLTDPVTGIHKPAAMDVLQPMILREAERITYEPLLRQVLNQPEVRQTRWFEQFKDHSDEALEDLRQRIDVVQNSDTPVLRVYATAETEEDAQIILRALRDEYLRQKQLAAAASHQRQLIAAQKSRDPVERAAAGSKAQVQRFLEVHAPGLEGQDLAKTRYLELEMDSLIRAWHQAEARHAKAIEHIELLSRNKNGFIGFVVSEDYPPQ